MVSVSTQKYVSLFIVGMSKGVACLSVDYVPSSVVCAFQGHVCLCLLLLCPEGCLCINYVIFCVVCVPLTVVWIWMMGEGCVCVFALKC